MKVYTLPAEQNKRLLKVLCGFNDYGRLMHNLQLYLESTKLEDAHKRNEVILLINKICLYNMYRYAEAGSPTWFATSLKNNTIAYEMNIDNVLVSEFFKPLMGMSVSDVDLHCKENLIIGELYRHITSNYAEHGSALNESFVGIYDMFSTYIPISQINLHRFEITPSLTPLMFCTEKHMRQHEPLYHN